MTGEKFGCGLRDELRDELRDDHVEIVHVVADRERTSAEGPHREFRGMHDRVAVCSRAQRRGLPREPRLGDITELFTQ